jgi:hypothetical protein
MAGMRTDVSGGVCVLTGGPPIIYSLSFWLQARGMRRSEILEALAAQLPDGSIRFNAAVSSVTADGAGGQETAAQWPAVNSHGHLRLVC